MPRLGGSVHDRCWTRPLIPRTFVNANPYSATLYSADRQFVLHPLSVHVYGQNVDSHRPTPSQATTCVRGQARAPPRILLAGILTPMIHKSLRHLLSDRDLSTSPDMPLRHSWRARRVPLPLTPVTCHVLADTCHLLTAHCPLPPDP
jgi:hypothetical protein